MRRMTWLVVLVMGCLLAGCGKDPAGEAGGAKPVAGAGAEHAASAEAAKNAAPTSAPRGPNERFYKVQEKLDPGGSFYMYVDAKGALEQFAGGLKEMIPQLGLPAAGSGMALAVLDEIGRTGIYGIQDVGISSLPEGDLFLNKFYLSMPEGPKGLFALGTAAHAFKGLDYAGADTMVFASYDLPAAGLLGYVRDAVKNVGGQTGLQAFNQKLLELNAQSGLNAEQMINSVAGGLTVLGTLDPAEKLTVPLPPGPQAGMPGATPPAPLQVDAPRLVLILDVKDATIYDGIKQLLMKQGAEGTETAAGELKQFALKVPPNPMWALEPVMASDGGHFYFATHKAYLQKALAAQKAGGGLATSAEFKRYAQGLPTEGNSMVFAGDKFMATYQTAMKNLMTASSGSNPAVQGFLQKQMGNARGCYSIAMKQPDGMLAISRSAQGTRAVFAAMAAVPVAIMAAIAVPNFLEAQTRSKVSRAKADSRSMANALESYYIDNNGYPPAGEEAQTRSKVSSAKDDCRSVATALEMYSIDWNGYPPTGELFRLTTPIAYITGIKQDPFAEPAGPLKYYATTKGCIVWSAGPDSKAELTPENIMRVYDPTQPVPSPLLTEATYDPTNGTTSPGDVWGTKQ